MNSASVDSLHSFKLIDKIGDQVGAAATDDGIFVDSVTGLTISANKFTNVSGSGIEVGSVFGASTNLNIQANTIDGANKNIPLLTDGGITVNPGAHTNMGITGNRVTNAGNGSLAVVGAVAGNPITASANVFDDFAPVGAADFSIFNDFATQTVFSVGNSLANGVPLGVANLGGGGVADILLTA
jgi:Right handed beta helix region